MPVVSRSCPAWMANWRDEPHKSFVPTKTLTERCARQTVYHPQWCRHWVKIADPEEGIDRGRILPMTIDLVITGEETRRSSKATVARREAVRRLTKEADQTVLVGEEDDLEDSSDAFGILATQPSP